MAKHKTFFGKIFGWIGDIFHDANKDLLKAAVKITEVVKTALNSHAADFITSLTSTQIDDKLLAIAREKVNFILAKELLVLNAGTPQTEDEAQDLAKKIIDGFGILNDADKAELYTKLSAKLYIFFKEHEGQKVTFGQAAALAESAYQTWIKYKEDSDDDND